jgi:hypothetical protein
MSSEGRQSEAPTPGMVAKDIILDTDMAWEMLRTTVPRRVLDLKKGAGGNQVSAYRLAQDGEHISPETGLAAENYQFQADSQELDEFGIGIGLYFRTLKQFGVIFLILGLVNILAAYENAKYNPDNTDPLLEGSVYGATFESLKFDRQVTADMLIVIFLLIFTIYMTRVEDDLIEQIDEGQQTTQDYAIWVKNPSPTLDSPEEYYNFFSKFGEVCYITIAKNNGDLIDALAERKSCHEKIKDLEDAGITDDMLTKDWARSLCISAGFAVGLEQLKSRVNELTTIIEAKRKQNYAPWRVFVVFNREEDQVYCKDCLSGFKNRMNFHEQLLLNGQKLVVEEAPEPSSVIYSSSHIGAFARYKSWVISFTVCGLLIASAYFIIKGLVGSEPNAVAPMVSILNTLLPTINKMMTLNLEVHDTFDSQQTSILIKLLVTRCLTATVLIYVATPFEERFDEDKLRAAQLVLVLDCFLGPILRLFDPFIMTMRYIVAPRVCVTQDELNHFFEATQWTLAERYTDVMKTAVVGLFYAVTIPSGLFVTSLAMIITYASDKFSLFNLWAKPPMLDANLAITARYFFGFAIWIHTSISLQFFANWPYASKEFERDCNIFICEIESDTMTDDQKTSIKLYSSFSIIIFVIVMIWYFNHSIIVGYYFFTNQNMPDEGEDEGCLPCLATNNNSNAGIPKQTFREVVGEHAYIPQVDRPELIDAVLCADVTNVPHHRHPRKVMDVVWDVEKNKFVPKQEGMRDEDSSASVDEYVTVVKTSEFKQLADGAAAESLFNNVFSKVVHYKPPEKPLKKAGLNKLSEFNFGIRNSIGRASLGGVGFGNKASAQAPPPLPTPSNMHTGISAATVPPPAPPTPPQEVSVKTTVLPDGWEEKKDKTGKVFYVDHNTKTTHWKLPRK